MRPKRTHERSKVRKLKRKIQQGKTELVVEAVSITDLACHSPLDQLVLASKIDVTIHQLIEKLETNVMMLGRLVSSSPRTQEVVKMIDDRSNLGIQILRLINSHVGLDVTRPIVETMWEICSREVKPITPEAPEAKKMVKKLKN